ncbi:disulfide bond formation protein B [Rhodoferax antarcticus]|uniref:disulfide bond formation protein B n=1 Tax=Rhodoferax antarcticus TaxID=81479 RepID=UPI002224331C|nr:disulfide bond formation protein B [Rhodoferax antarcticus]MCW2313494.1 disulfide bond formation protein DsbB [Rhodoferax antarcticus]
MFSRLLAVLDSAPRRVFLAIGAICIAMFGYGLYLQQYAGLNPCPMCIVQRYALIFVAIVALLAGVGGQKSIHIAGAALLLLISGFGAFVAARQSWLQWYPPEVATCGRDFYGMIESFPLQRAIPMIFRGSGDCYAVDWTFLGGTLANWSFVSFTAFGVLAVLMIWRRARQTPNRHGA